MTVVRCKFCDRTCAGPAGLASHLRSMHANESADERADELEHAARVAGLHVVPRDGEGPPGFEWVDTLPPRRRRSLASDLEPMVAELRANPGRWAKLATTNKASAGSTRTRLATLYADCEFAVRRNGITATIYGRCAEAAAS